MPVIKLEISKLSSQQKKELISEFTKTAAKITGIDEEAFVTLIQEYDTDNVGVGGNVLTELIKK